MNGNDIYDYIITGAGLYGLYSAVFLSDRGKRVLIIERDPTVMRRATKINQARIHNGYHYPRSLSTAVKSAHYYRRFHEDFSFCIKQDFKQIYATSSSFSWTDREQFLKFTQAAGIPCSEENTTSYFKEGMVDGVFVTEEDTYDADILRDHFLKLLSSRSDRIDLLTDTAISDISLSCDSESWIIAYENRQTKSLASSPSLLNASYASVNQILNLANKALAAAGESPLPLFNIKYELCEIILCAPGERLKDVGITVMDGPFFSVMPFGRSGLHSLTAVTHTPHSACLDVLPSFSCQENTTCSPSQLENCNDCPNKPLSAWPYMKRLAEKYLLSEFTFDYRQSLFSMKPILKSAEIDDSRPTAIRTDKTEGGARLLSVLSGKINTVYDLDEVLT